MNKVVIIDYGVGNVHSVYNALNELGYKVSVSSNEKDLDNAAALILPGVGAFGAAVEQLKRNGLTDKLNEQVINKKKPIIGICLGMQLLADSSEENGFHQGLGWIPGLVKKLELPAEFKIPHVGWNNAVVKKNCAMFDRLDNEPNFYFDHSYHFECDLKYIAATCSYGKEVVAAVNHENISGVQFHPEKSQVNGLKLFRGFLNKALK